MAASIISGSSLRKLVEDLLADMICFWVNYILEDPADGGPAEWLPSMVHYSPVHTQWKACQNKWQE